MLLVLHLLGKGALVGATVLNMAVFGAVIAYAMQALSFLLLRKRKPHIERPYVSTLGIPGAAVALVISVITFLMLFANPDYRPAIWWCRVVPCRPRLFRPFYARPYGAIARRGVCAPGDKRR